VTQFYISLIQAFWATITLYRARGDQIDECGYAAFGLTVAPYACMSLLNIVANLLTPEYSALFLVRTPVMEEAEADGGFFSGEILVKIDHDSPAIRDNGGSESNYEVLIALCLGLIPLAIVGTLSRFRPANSTSLERGFTMSWLAIGIFFGEIGGRRPLTATPDLIRIITVYASNLVIGVGAIGGMVVVGNMISKFGVCTIIS